jgi:hydrogenase-4 component F
MLAYSSVEHMGILLLGLGAGGAALSGGMLHMVCHSLTKAALFLLAGNILTTYKTQTSCQITGLNAALPRTGPLWLAGLFAIVGSPPFGIFTSEFIILRGLLSNGFGLVPFLYLLCLGMIFVGMAENVLRMTQGDAPEGVLPATENPLSIAPSACLLAAALVLGTWQPVWLKSLLFAAAQALGGIPF